MGSAPTVVPEDTASSLPSSSSAAERAAAAVAAEVVDVDETVELDAGKSPEFWRAAGKASLRAVLVATLSHAQCGDGGFGRASRRTLGDRAAAAPLASGTLAAAVAAAVAAGARREGKTKERQYYSPLPRLLHPMHRHPPNKIQENMPGPAEIVGPRHVGMRSVSCNAGLRLAGQGKPADSSSLLVVLLIRDKDSDGT